MECGPRLNTNDSLSRRFIWIYVTVSWPSLLHPCKWFVLYVNIEIFKHFCQFNSIQLILDTIISNMLECRFSYFLLDVDFHKTKFVYCRQERHPPSSHTHCLLILRLYTEGVPKKAKTLFIAWLIIQSRSRGPNLLIKVTVHRKNILSGSPLKVPY